MAAELAAVNGDSYLEAAAMRQRAKILALTGRWPDAHAAHVAADAAYQGLGPRRDTLIELLLAFDEPDWPRLDATGARSYVR